MRRRIAAALIAVATLAVASACSTPPPGTDGDLINQWGAMVAPTGWEPVPGACHNEIKEITIRSSYTPLACTTSHRAEAVHIGAFAGAAAQLPAPPKEGSPELAAALAECQTKANEYLGGDWRHGHLRLSVSVPASGNWNGGARWYICGVTLEESWVPGPKGGLERSVKGEFAKESDLKFGCYDLPEDKSAAATLKACTEAHNAEFTGIFPLDSYDDADANRDTLHKSCRSVIAGYAAVPDNNDMQYRTGTYLVYPSRAEWEAGDRWVRCFMWMDEKKFTRSIKGGGTRVLPVN
jgi:hypothetical protein